MDNNDITYTTKKEAKAAGAKFYKSAQDCPKQHDSVRYTSNGICIICMRTYVPSNTPRDTARKDATAEGLLIYQGKPCRKGHDGTRYTKTGGCKICVLEAQAELRATPENKEYKRKHHAQWSKENPDKAKAIARRHYQKHKVELRRKANEANAAKRASNINLNDVSSFVEGELMHLFKDHA